MESNNHVNLTTNLALLSEYAKKNHPSKLINIEICKQFLHAYPNIEVTPKKLLASCRQGDRYGKYNLKYSESEIKAILDFIRDYKQDYFNGSGGNVWKELIATQNPVLEGRSVESLRNFFKQNILGGKYLEKYPDNKDVVKKLRKPKQVAKDGKKDLEQSNDEAVTLKEGANFVFTKASSENEIVRNVAQTCLKTVQELYLKLKAVNGEEEADRSAMVQEYTTKEQES